MCYDEVGETMRRWKNFRKIRPPPPTLGGALRPCDGKLSSVNLALPGKFSSYR